MNTVEEGGICCICASSLRIWKRVLTNEEASGYEIDNENDRISRVKSTCTVCNYAYFYRSENHMLQIGEDQFGWYRGGRKPTQDINKSVEINRARWISMHPEEKAFVLALAADPYDTVVCKIYADWLDDNDRPEEADERRLWTHEKQESKDWLTGFAADLFMSYECLMDITKDNYKDNRYGYCLPFDTPDRVYEEAELLWRHYETVTGNPTSGRNDTFFRCAC